MATLIISLFLFFPFCLTTTSELSRRIVYGDDAEPDDVPYQVRLLVRFISLEDRPRKSLNCGGSILSPKIILSAAHCFIHEDETYKYNSSLAITGHLRYGVTNSAQTKRGVHVHTHPNYNILDPSRIKFNYDIAVLELEREFNFNQLVNSIALNVEEVPDNLPCLISGWGVIEPLTASEEKDRKRVNKAKCADALQVANVLSITNKKCFRGPNVMCARNRNTLATTCSGDSGGPITCKNILFGVTAGGSKGCGQKRSRQFFVDVSKHLSFIKKKSGKEAKNIIVDGINTPSFRLVDFNEVEVVLQLKIEDK